MTPTTDTPTINCVMRCHDRLHPSKVRLSQTIGRTRFFMCEGHHQEHRTLGLAKVLQTASSLSGRWGSCRTARQQSTFSESYGGRDVPVGFFTRDCHGSFSLLPGLERIGERALAGCAPSSARTAPPLPPPRFRTVRVLAELTRKLCRWQGHFLQRYLSKKLAWTGHG
jgi:hypothetical protein